MLNVYLLFLKCYAMKTEKNRVKDPLFVLYWKTELLICNQESSYLHPFSYLKYKTGNNSSFVIVLILLKFFVCNSVVK